MRIEDMRLGPVMPGDEKPEISGVYLRHWPDGARYAYFNADISKWGQGYSTGPSFPAEECVTHASNDRDMWSVHQDDLPWQAQIEFDPRETAA